MARLWAFGFGTPVRGEPFASVDNQVSQDGGRWYQGYGYVKRAPAAAPVGARATLPRATTICHERFWMRVRAYPTAEEQIWYQFDTIHGGVPVWSLTMNQAGGIRLYGGSLQAFIGAPGIGFPLNTWTKITILSQYNVGGQDKITINGVPFAMTGFASGNVQYSTCGTDSSSNFPLNGAWIDVTDWVGDDSVTGIGADSFVAGVQPTANGTVSPPAAGVSYLNLAQLAPPGDTTSDVTIADQGSISVAFPALTTLFPLATVLCMNLSAWIDTGNGNVQVNLYQGGTQMATSGNVAPGSNAWAKYFVAPMPAGFSSATAFEVQFVNKSGGNIGISALLVSAEIAGSTTVPTAPSGNDTTLYAQSGTYVGDGIGQIINLIGPTPGLKPFAPTWVFGASTNINASGGFLLWTTMEDGHDFLARKIVPDKIPFIRTTVLSTSFAVSGPNNQVNASGTTYQYVVLGDPSLRTLALGQAATKLVVDPLTRSIALPFGFTVAGIWAFRETFNRSSVTGSYVRGPGHTGLNSSPLDGAQVTTAIVNPNAGSAGMLWGSLLTDDSPGSAWIAFRTDRFYTVNLFDWTSFTGDGTSAKTVTLKLSGRVPMFELIVPHDGTGSYFRLPGFAAGQARSITGLGLTDNAITAVGPNSVTVGTRLNTNGVVYEVFAIAGPSTTVESFGVVSDTDGAKMTTPCGAIT